MKKKAKVSWKESMKGKTFYAAAGTKFTILGLNDKGKVDCVSESGFLNWDFSVDFVSEKLKK